MWSHPDFEFVHGDVRDRETLRKAVSECDAVVHLAAIVGDPACAREPETARAVNLDASMNLIEESRRAGVQRFVFASTCSNYGKMKDPSQFVNEESELQPVSLYARDKGCCRESFCLRVQPMAGVPLLCASPRSSAFLPGCGLI